MTNHRSQNHTIVALVEDKPGVLNRIASKWRQRGFNIESLAVGHSEISAFSRTPPPPTDRLEELQDAVRR